MKKLYKYLLLKSLATETLISVLCVSALLLIYFAGAGILIETISATAVFMIVLLWAFLVLSDVAVYVSHSHK